MRYDDLNTILLKGGRYVSETETLTQKKISAAEAGIYFSNAAAVSDVVSDKAI